MWCIFKSLLRMMWQLSTGILTIFGTVSSGQWWPERTISCMSLWCCGLSTLLIIFQFTVVLEPMMPHKHLGPGDNLFTIYHPKYLPIFPLAGNILWYSTAQVDPLSHFWIFWTLWSSLTPITSVTATDCHQVYIRGEHVKTWASRIQPPCHNDAVFTFVPEHFEGTNITSSVKIQLCYSIILLPPSTSFNCKWSHLWGHILVQSNPIIIIKII
jgi:hypothetical protein